ncbi:MAG: hypothetical protein DMF40_01880 [Verrucomicrobia bacterium]|nr:MAG: hypothetical protein DMF40_01880 [Verrucomicrobiota bacterium]
MESNDEDKQNFHHCNSPSRRVLRIAQDLVKRTRSLQKPGHLCEAENAAESVNRYIGPWSYRIDQAVARPLFRPCCLWPAEFKQ